VVYNIEPSGGAVRKGSWKLVWRANLPTQIELFDLATDPSEQANVAGKNPEKVTELQNRIEALARESVPPLLMKEAFGVTWRALTSSTLTPR